MLPPACVTPSACPRPCPHPLPLAPRPAAASIGCPGRSTARWRSRVAGACWPQWVTTPQPWSTMPPAAAPPPPVRSSRLPPACPPACLPACLQPAVPHTRTFFHLAWLTRRHALSSNPPSHPPPPDTAAAAAAAAADSGGPLRPVATLRGHHDYSFAVAWHPSEPHLLATGSQDKTTRVWDLRHTARALAVLQAHIGAVRSLRFRCVRCVGGGRHALIILTSFPNSAVSFPPGPLCTQPHLTLPSPLLLLPPPPPPPPPPPHTHYPAAPTAASWPRPSQPTM